MHLTQGIIFADAVWGVRGVGAWARIQAGNPKEYAACWAIELGGVGKSAWGLIFPGPRVPVTNSIEKSLELLVARTPRKDFWDRLTLP